LREEEITMAEMNYKETMAFVRAQKTRKKIEQ